MNRLVTLTGKTILQAETKNEIVCLVADSDGYHLVSNPGKERLLAVIKPANDGAIIISKSNVLVGPNNEDVFSVKNGQIISLGVDAYKIKIKSSKTYRIMLCMGLLVALFSIIFVYTNNTKQMSKRNNLQRAASELKKGRWWMVSDMKGEGKDWEYIKESAEEMRLKYEDKRKNDTTIIDSSNKKYLEGNIKVKKHNLESAIRTYHLAIDELGDLRPDFYEDLIQKNRIAEQKHLKRELKKISAWKKEAELLKKSEPFVGALRLKKMKTYIDQWNDLIGSSEQIVSAVNAYNESCQTLANRAMARASAVIELEGCKKGKKMYFKIRESFKDIKPRVSELANVKIKQCK